MELVLIEDWRIKSVLYCNIAVELFLIIYSDHSKQLDGQPFSVMLESILKKVHNMQYKCFPV